MKSGILYFAFNNGSIDYLKIANWSAKRAQRHLNLPVSIVTNKMPDFDHCFDQVIVTEAESTNTRYFSDFDKTVDWHNANRTDSYEITPYDRTLVLDVDYVIASNDLLPVIHSRQDFLCPRTAFDVTGVNSFDDLNWFGKYRMPMPWATVMCFGRNRHAESIFYSMKMIKKNWNHYRNLYHIAKGTYRNDYALGIALNLTNGHTPVVDSIPWQLASTVPDHRVTQIDQDSFRVQFKTVDGKSRYVIVDNLDLHVMGKKDLGEIVDNTQ